MGEEEEEEEEEGSRSLGVAMSEHMHRAGDTAGHTPYSQLHRKKRKKLPLPPSPASTHHPSACVRVCTGADRPQPMPIVLHAQLLKKEEKDSREGWGVGGFKVHGCLHPPLKEGREGGRREFSSLLHPPPLLPYDCLIFLLPPFVPDTRLPPSLFPSKDVMLVITCGAEFLYRKMPSYLVLLRVLLPDDDGVDFLVINIGGRNSSFPLGGNFGAAGIRRKKGREKDRRMVVSE